MPPDSKVVQNTTGLHFKGGATLGRLICSSGHSLIRRSCSSCEEHY